MKSLPKKTEPSLRFVTPRQALEDLTLPDELRASFFRLKREHDRRALLARSGIKPRNRLLFYGPPGNGKTASSEALANLLGLDFCVVNYAGIIDSYHGETEKGVVRMFEAIGQRECLVLLDEADSILSSRVSARQAADRSNNSATNLMLTGMDQLPATVVMIAATNRMGDLDAAVGRRFDLRVEFKPPTYEQQVDFCSAVIKRYSVLKGKIAPKDIVGRVAGESFAELEKAVIDHARQAIVGD